MHSEKTLKIIVELMEENAELKKQTALSNHMLSVAKDTVSRVEASETKGAYRIHKAAGDMYCVAYDGVWVNGAWADTAEGAYQLAKSIVESD